MTPYYESLWATVYNADCLEALRALPDASVQCCVTSPPYWGLRDYGTGTWTGGDADHDHDTTKARGGRGGSGTDAKETAQPDTIAADVCSCGATRVDDQVGLEATPDEYITRLLEIFREVRRVLRDDGTLWLNLGDCYATGAGKVGDCPGGGGQGDQAKRWFGKHNSDGNPRTHGVTPPNRMPIPGLKPKDLCMMPARVAMALQADGWYLRSDIIWHKPNPMPESVTDRPTKAHEYVFLLSKSARYYYDADSVAERVSGTSAGGARHPSTLSGGKGANGITQTGGKESSGLGLGWAKPFRNRRTVWTIHTQPYRGAHFAVFPPALVEPCIKAGCPVGGIVLDPFAGSGTVAQVARDYGRKSVLVELSAEYCALIRNRLSQGVLWAPPLEAP